MEEAHSGKARLGDLRRPDRIIRAGCLSPAHPVQLLVALAEIHEVRLRPVRRSEIEMAPVDPLEEAGSAQVLVVAQRIDVGPERACRARYAAFTRKILTAIDNRRREAEIEAEQGRLFGSLSHQPVGNLCSRPYMAGSDE